MSSRAARIRRFSRQDRRPVVAMLCRAFADDPVIRWFLPATKGGDSLSRFFRASLIRDVLPHGEVQVAEHDGKIVGAALWRHPGEWHNNGVSQLLDLPWWLWVFGRDLQRAGEGLDAMKRAHPSDPHWYLPTIGVDPGAQGLGVGSALMLAMLQRCDSERSPAYLESSKHGNVAFYERHGFKLMDERHLPDGPLFWPMWRDPAPTGTS